MQHRTFLTTLIFTASVIAQQQTQGQLPARMQSAIDRARLELTEVRGEARAGLLEAFSKRSAEIRRMAKLTPAQRQDALAAIEAEKKIFEEHEWVPFSPMLRTHTLKYLSDTRRAETGLGKALDKAADYHTKRGDDADAKAVIAAKENLSSRVVGTLTARKRSGKYHGRWPLFSDGTHPDGSWTLDRNVLVLRHPNKDAPGGVWIDVAIISPDGQSAELKNQTGTQFTGEMNVPEKE